MLSKVKILLTIIAFIVSTNNFAQNSQDFEVSKNIEIFSDLYRQIYLNYVDEINHGEMFKTAIDAMLETLDPYTQYIPESDIEDYKLMTTGQYGGIGALIHKQKDFIVISEPYFGFPAYNAGLRAGDQLLEIAGKSTKNKSVSDISSILKGQPGTVIELKVLKFGKTKAENISITREEIKIDNIPYYGMVTDSIGYIRLTQFTMNAGKEVKEAFIALKNKKTLKALIFDLRGNGGGLLQEAVNIVNVFVDKDQIVVTTKGKLAERNSTHKTSQPAVDLKIPIIMLVDENSASASEIVAGAFQDLDRAVIIGNKTYGKGLVQNIFPISYNAQVKITIAKYYIPSGRCIQVIDYSKKDNNGKALKSADSLKTSFKTKNGRLVYDMGGIMPDIIVEKDDISNITISLITKYHIFDYATKYYSNNPQLPDSAKFEITEDIYNDFVKYLADKEYDYTTISEKKLEELKENAEDEKYFDAIKSEYEALKAKLNHDKTQDLIKFKQEIKYMLKLEIVSRYYFQKGRLKFSLSEDKDVLKAIEIVNNSSLYNSILNGTYKTNINK